MTRHSMRFHIIRGALIGIAGALALGLAAMTLMSPGASAQAATCLAHDSLAKLLDERYAERRVAAGLGSGGALIELFASAESASWTMVVTTAAGESCVMAAGDHWMEFKRPPVGGPAA